jgi:hypothetical protein
MVRRTAAAVSIGRVCTFSRLQAAATSIRARTSGNPRRRPVVARKLAMIRLEVFTEVIEGVC